MGHTFENRVNQTLQSLILHERISALIQKEEITLYSFVGPAIDRNEFLRD